MSICMDIVAIWRGQSRTRRAVAARCLVVRGYGGALPVNEIRNIDNLEDSPPPSATNTVFDVVLRSEE